MLLLFVALVSIWLTHLTPRDTETSAFDDELVDCSISPLLFVAFNNTFPVIWRSLRGTIFCLCTIGTMSAVSYNNALKDGLVLGQNTNNFPDTFHPSAPSLITASAGPRSSTSVDAFMSGDVARTVEAKHIPYSTFLSPPDFRIWSLSHRRADSVSFSLTLLLADLRKLNS